MTGGRIKRIKPYVNDEPFMMTYGDGVCDIDLKKLFEFHKSHGKIATLTAVNEEQRFGVLDIDKDTSEIKSFREKSESDRSRINAGYMVLNPEVFDYIEGDATVFEKDPLQNLAADGELVAYKYDGFWQCMDTLREQEALAAMVESGKAPWMVW